MKTASKYQTWYAVLYRSGGISVHPFISEFALEFAKKNKLVKKVMSPFFARTRDDATIIAERALRN